MSLNLANFVGHVADRRSSTWMFAAVVALIFAGLDIAAEFLLVNIKANPAVHVGTQALIIGLGAGFTAVVLLTGRRERRRMIRNELLRVAELNHNLRNSLQIITDAHYISTYAAGYSFPLRDVTRNADNVLLYYSKTGYEFTGVSVTKRTGQWKVNSFEKFW